MFAACKHQSLLDYFKKPSKQLSWESLIRMNEEILSMLMQLLSSF